MYVSVEVSLQTKLTLRLDGALVRRAKAYARRSGKSVSAMVADFFALLGPDTDSRRGRGQEKEAELTPTVRSLLGVLPPKSVSEDQYRRYLERKHS